MADPFAPQPAPPPAYVAAPYGPPPSNGIAIAAMVVGIVALVLALTIVFAFVSFVPGILAIVLGAVGLSRAGRHPTGLGRGSAIAGIVCGILATLASVAAIAVVALLVSAVEHLDLADTRAAEPGEYEVSDQTCLVEDGTAVAGGVLKNRTVEAPSGFVVTVRFFSHDVPVGRGTDTIEAGLGQGQTWEWNVSIPVDPERVNTDNLDCHVARVEVGTIVSD